MSFETQILELLKTVVENQNKIATNGKHIYELPEQTTLDLDNKIHVDLNENSYYMTLQRLKDFLNPTASQVIKETLIPETNNQVQFIIPGKPEVVHIQKGRTNLIEDTEDTTYDYDYDADNGILTLAKGLKVDADPTQTEKLFLIGFSSQIGTKQVLEATEDNQTEFFFSGAPSIIQVITGRTNRIENTADTTYDYTRTRYSTNNKITLTKGVPIGSLITLIKF